VVGQIGVEGARELRKALKTVGDEAKAGLKEVNLEIAEIVARAAVTRVPSRSGALRETVRAAGAQTRASVKVGKKKVPYAGPIHFGWPARGIAPNMFLYDALDARRDEVMDAYTDGMADLIKKNGLG
jgi:sarcosine oxidase gamma subunit